ncbi:MAG: hypothetical protein OWU84_05295 [Firmicutes bacterium]|nr:hypothetical protein [Bacillota bacterium]
MTEKDIVIVSVDRSRADMVIINTAVEFLHCPIRVPKEVLRALGYTVFRPQKLKPFVHAVVFRQAARHGGQIPLGGIEITADDLEGLPVNPMARASSGDSGDQSKSEDDED